MALVQLNTATEANAQEHRESGTLIIAAGFWGPIKPLSISSPLLGSYEEPTVISIRAFTIDGFVAFRPIIFFRG